MGCPCKDKNWQRVLRENVHLNLAGPNPHAPTQWVAPRPKKKNHRPHVPDPNNPPPCLLSPTSFKSSPTPSSATSFNIPIDPLCVNCRDAKPTGSRSCPSWKSPTVTPSPPSAHAAPTSFTPLSAPTHSHACSPPARQRPSKKGRCATCTESPPKPWAFPNQWRNISAL